MWISFVLILIVCPYNAQAANPYRLGELDYFKESVHEPSGEDYPFDWSDLSMKEDGSLQVHKPPKVIVDLLEYPSKENAKLYLNWQQMKIRRIIQAQRMIDEVLKEGLP